MLVLSAVVFEKWDNTNDNHSTWCYCMCDVFVLVEVTKVEVREIIENVLLSILSRVGNIVANCSNVKIKS
jgi:hypothetical protein